MSLGALPSAPEISQLILERLDHEDPDLRELARLVERDRALAAALVRVANSAVFAGARPLSGLPDALTRLGVRRVRHVLLSLSLWDAFGVWHGRGRRLRVVLWHHAVRVAATAGCVAGRTRVASGEAFAAGLLHDIGKAALGHQLGDDYWQLLEETGDGDDDLVARELEMLDYHHALVGEWLLTHWHVPPPLVAAVADHHDPQATRGRRDLIGVVAIADLLVEAGDRAADARLDATVRALAALDPPLADDDETLRLAAQIVEAQRSALENLGGEK